jgi:hypothetical protein
METRNRTKYKELKNKTRTRTKQRTRNTSDIGGSSEPQEQNKSIERLSAT